MTDQRLIQTGTATQVEFYPDEFRIGQAKVARIKLELADKQMAEAAPKAFSTDYVTPEWRAMCRRMFTEGRAEYDRAKVALTSMGEFKS